jgi:hypothetical protein
MNDDQIFDLKLQVGFVIILVRNQLLTASYFPQILFIKSLMSALLLSRPHIHQEKLMTCLSVFKKIRFVTSIFLA